MQRIVVIGNGMVGYKFCAKLVEKNGLQRYTLTVFGEEPRVAYDRVQLTKYFSGSTVEDLTLAPKSWYTENNIDLRLNDRVASIDPVVKTVTSFSGEVLSYDQLVLATGSAPFVPSIPGVDKEGVFVYRTIEDLELIMAYAPQATSAAVIGGGLLGLEAAKALVDLKVPTHVVEFAPRLMPRQLDQIGSDFLKAKIEALGVNVHLNKNTKMILGNGALDRIEFADDETLHVNMLVISAGIRPRDELAREAKIEVGPRGGISVNEHMQTSDDSIYAIGECALFNGMIYGLVAPGYQMAEVVADNLLGGDKTFTGADMSTKLKLMGVDVASFGNAFAKGPFVVDVAVSDDVNGVYKKMVIDRQKNELLGGILVGDAGEYGALLQMCQNRMSLPKNPTMLLVKGDAAAAGNSIDGMPDTATICSCENITKGALVAMMEDGVTTIEGLKKCTKAGTGCGGCVPLLNDLITTQLKKLGGAVNNALCTHFTQTRQELVELITQDRVTTFTEALTRYGTGQGCEICKPAVASILASYVNEHVMRHQNIQDTNDAFMANIQKNGSYSVVPRVPGGEITPDQLMAIGAVAKEFNLYTKITGGQRIDLFGARVEQLPKIWAKLIAAGLESGHAYAKSLRTVKSCVGSTWCRFGVQDSVGLAIEIENRYKGLRSPHKLKSAVSGCSRECAEAQSKDFGVIATDKGYNLYVCGNGGMKPQHALLFAEDLDKMTLIKYIDRFLMYYIRTADRLTRTATWLNRLDGGIARLKEIIIDDALGICVELEAQMQHQVDTYQCEWKAVLQDQAQLKRFMPFVNSDESDTTIEFVDVRGQICPNLGMATVDA